MFAFSCLILVACGSSNQPGGRLDIPTIPDLAMPPADAQDAAYQDFFVARDNPTADPLVPVDAPDTFLTPELVPEVPSDAGVEPGPEPVPDVPNDLGSDLWLDPGSEPVPEPAPEPALDIPAPDFAEITTDLPDPVPSLPDLPNDVPADLPADAIPDAGCGTTGHAGCPCLADGD
jgi:hypothetical protein